MKPYDGKHTIDQLVRDLQTKVKDGLYNVYLKTHTEEDRKLITFEDFCNNYIVDTLEYSSRTDSLEMTVRPKTPEEILEEKEEETQKEEDLSYYSHSDCENYWEKFHDEFECGDGHWWWETGCYADGDPDVFGVCKNFKKGCKTTEW